MTVLGNLDPTPLTAFFGQLQTTEVIVTDERIAHIKERHPEDLLLFEQYGREAVLSPDLIIRDSKAYWNSFCREKTAGYEPECCCKACAGNR